MSQRASGVCGGRSRWAAACMTALFFAVLSALTFAQSAPSAPNLKLSLEPGEQVAGVPRSFKLVLTNVTDHAIRLANPALNCSNVDTGSIDLRVKFTGTAEPTYRGCFGDDLVVPIAKRLATWSVLMPGQSLQFPTSLEDEVFIPERGAVGTYEIWAAYEPPFVSEGDQAALKAQGVDFPRKPLQSPHLSFHGGPQ